MDTSGMKILRRDEAGYEEARTDACWNERVPPRFPEIIAFPRRIDQVQVAIQYARSIGMAVSTKSGGHSWAGTFLREGCLLLDLRHMNEITIDPHGMTAKVGPAALSGAFSSALMQHGLSFPTGHCPTVALGGFLLQGGFGWNGRSLGVACESVIGLDVVDATGEHLYADVSNNADYYWAARGSGCGFFGVVCNFYLKVHKLPQVTMISRYRLPFRALEDVYRGISEISTGVPKPLEVWALVDDSQHSAGEPIIGIYAIAFTETEQEARKCLKILDDIPDFRLAMDSERFAICTNEGDMHGILGELAESRGLRHARDNIWTNCRMEELAPKVRSIISGLPASPSGFRILTLLWCPDKSRQLPDMAFSLQADAWISIHNRYTDADLDEEVLKYVVQSTKAMNDVASGMQLSDENLVANPAEFMALEHFEKLERLRAKYDPEGRFVSYMRIPLRFEKAKAQLWRETAS